MFMVPIVGFKDVPGNYYHITRSGEVWRKKPNGTWKPCSKYVSKRGYWSITLGNLKPRAQYKCHPVTIIRLMKMYIFGVDDPKVFINHKDGNKLNDDIDNLELSNALHNTHHAIDAGLFKATKLTYDIIADIRRYAQDNIDNPNRLKIKHLSKSKGISEISCRRILSGTIRNMNLENLYDKYTQYRTDEVLAKIKEDIKNKRPMSHICREYKIDYYTVRGMM